MIDIRTIKNDPIGSEKLLRSKRRDVDVQKLVAADARYTTLLQENEAARNEKNLLTKQVPKATKAAREKLISKIQKINISLKKNQQLLENAEKTRLDLLLSLPNFPSPDVRKGTSERENEVLREVGTKTVFHFEPVDYLHLVRSLQLAEIERAAKTSGTRFVFLTNQLVLLQYAIVMYTLQFLQKKGFTLIVPPVLINRQSMEGMGYLGHGGSDEVYHLEKDDMFLVGTAEQSIGPMLQGDIVMEKDLPLRYAACSTCFRREAGSYGRDTRGFLRAHQFDKIEMFSFTHPDASDTEHELFLSLEEELMQSLHIPYRVVKMCTADLGDPAARKYDLEAWLPSEQTYRETHSTSTCTDYQARRLNIRYRKAGASGVAYVHTVNGTAFALGRTMIMIIENFQQKDGSIAVPDVLIPYCGFSMISSEHGNS